MASTCLPDPPDWKHGMAPLRRSRILEELVLSRVHRLDEFEQPSILKLHKPNRQLYNSNDNRDYPMSSDQYDESLIQL